MQPFAPLHCLSDPGTGAFVFSHMDLQGANRLQDFGAVSMAARESPGNFADRDHVIIGRARQILGRRGVHGTQSLEMAIDGEVMVIQALLGGSAFVRDGAKRIVKSTASILRELCNCAPN